eukprot:TRINITY_DN3048_c0_g1_i3.p2 TRINITY_DN3048_c0_g1~~TRINITY_DN3048_c0_g1_i3.p2  ORF type:complete len:112 (+),score=16.59 TRINITY_DN3048_c0_g1_i3:973-1308(+)
MGRPYAMNNEIVETDVMAVNATVLPKYGKPMQKAMNTESHTAFTGTPVLGLDFFHKKDPGIALSRENANVILEQLIMQLIPQKNIAPVTICMARTPPVPEPYRPLKTDQKI